MSFGTVTFTSPASGGGGQVTTTGTFSASVTGNADGSVSGTWSYSGTYQAYATSGTENLSGTLAGTGGTGGPWTVTLVGQNLIGQSATLSYANGQYSLSANAAFYVTYKLDLGYGGEYTYEAPVQFHANAAVVAAGPSSSTDGNDTFTLTGGNATIDGGLGIDTAVFSDVRANYTVTHVSDSTWTVAHTGAETDTLMNVERLLFSDSKLAIDIDGNGGKAYRLYQAAFDRVPDVPGLGYQMNQLDLGRTLSSVATDFLNSPEFQSKYGNVDDPTYVNLLYQHVLHRAAQQFEIDYHVNQELHNGYSRADVLTFFSESPENQLNVAATIGSGMVYIYP